MEAEKSSLSAVMTLVCGLHVTMETVLRQLSVIARVTQLHVRSWKELAIQIRDWSVVLEISVLGLKWVSRAGA